MELHELKTKQDKAYNNSQVTRERGSDDLVFYWITQWDDNLLATSDLSYRGEFNILKKSGRQILSDLRANPVQVDFEPMDENRDDQAEIMDGIYRSDDRRNSSQEAYLCGQQEAVVCGVGAWELYTDYETVKGGNTNQVIKRSPIYEANNRVFWDPDARLMDKSDAMYCCVLEPYSKDAYKEMVTDILGEDYSFDESNFSYPQYSYAFPWTGGNFEWVYVGEFYQKELVEDAILFLLDPITEEVQEFYASDLEPVMDEYIDMGFEIVDEKKTKRWEVTKYICSGEQILSEEVIAGENIPIVPIYGERTYVEGQEHWEGITRLAKDPQRLRNFMMSYIADIASRSPRPKPIFNPEQIQGFEDMYDMAGADNNYPYLLQNRTDANGNPLPIGPTSMMPEQSVPTSVLQLGELTRQAVEDVAPSSAPQDIADIDLSGDALVQLNNRIDQQSHVFQENTKHAKRRDAEIYASMASRIYDTPRQVTVTKPDGTRDKIKIMTDMIDPDTGESIKVNDIRNAEFDVFAEIGPSYSTQKDQVRKEITMQLQTMTPDDPMRLPLQLKYAELIDGVDMKDIREYAREQAVIRGFKKPETDEEIALVQAISQNQQPDAQTIAAMAMDKEAMAKLAQQEREWVKDQADIQNDQVNTAIKGYEAQTKRVDVELKAQVAGANLKLNQAKAVADQYNTLRTSVNR